MSRALATTTHFLNVDLDLESRQDLAPLLAAFGEKVVVLYSSKQRGLHIVSLELAEFSRYVEPETCIARFVQIVRRLPIAARRLWTGAAKRRFNIGIQAPRKGEPYVALLEAATLRGASGVGGEIVITVYPPPVRTRKRNK